MASPAEMKAYFANAPKPPPKDATDAEKAKYDKDKAAFEKKAGPPPAPAPVSVPSAPGGGGEKPAARITDICAHGGLIILGCPTVLIGSLPAARITDMHVCPMFTGIIPHVGGPIIPPTSFTVLIGGLPAARMGDKCVCVGPPDMIAMGCFTTLIG
jgi:uncharacterized Zn-binding protein involved in type VI secretion